MEKQIKKACCGFGHRQVFENITEQLDKAVLDAAEKGCEIFYTGAMGDFDSLFPSERQKDVTRTSSLYVSSRI